MPKKVISVLSGKGGVGKTTLAVNTAVSLSMAGISTIIIDADFYNPCVGFHLGLPPRSAGLQDLLKKKAKLEDILTIHSISGLRCVSGSMKLRKDASYKSFPKFIKSLKYECVIIDCAPGISEPVKQAIDASDQFFLLMTPDIPSSSAAMKLAHLMRSKSKNKKIDCILNRISNSRYELHTSEIESVLKNDIYAKIPEDINIPKSIASKTPVVVFSPSAKSSKSIINLSKKLSNENKFEKTEHLQRFKGVGVGLFSKIFRR